MSALEGDNVVDRSKQMAWYNGPSLLERLENVPIESELNTTDFRFPVQLVIEKNALAGSIMSGALRKGDEISVIPSGGHSRIRSIEVDGKEIQEARAPMAILVRLEDEIDVNRGDVFVHPKSSPVVSRDMNALICWMDNKTMVEGGKYLLMSHSQQAQCVVGKTHYKMNINTLSPITDNLTFKINDIGKISIRTKKAVVYDPYRKNRLMGSFILVDEVTHLTAAAGVVLHDE